MKHFSFFFLMLLFSLMSFAEYNAFNSVSRNAILLYKLDSQGFYQRYTNIPVDVVDDILSYYAYDKKNKKLYVLTYYGNYVITLDGDMEKMVKKNKNIPQYKPDEIQEIISIENSSLDAKFFDFNKSRENHINDSIAQERERERKAALEKARKDSIERANELAERQALEDYRAKHKWTSFPIERASLKCALCDKSVSGYSVDSVLVVAMNNDTLFSVERKEGLIDLYYLEMHAYAIPSDLKNSKKFQYHINAFSDSIAKQKHMDCELARNMNAYWYKEYTDNVIKQAPHGLFTDWGWDADYLMVTFEFDFLNLDKRTIKYIDVYWNIYNDVDDLRGSGHFKGTGPLEQYSTGSWSWDNSMYFVDGDASWMKFTKVIITYMNGQKLILTGKKIIY